MEQNEVKKSKAGLIVLLMVLVLALGGIVGFFVGKSFDEPKTEVKEESKDDESKEETEEIKEESLTFNKDDAGSKLIPGALINVYDENLIPGDKLNRSNILADTQVKFEFVYYMSITKFSKDGKALNSEQEEYPEEMIDAYNVAVEYGTFKNYYKEVYGVEFSDSMIPASGFKLYNGYLYGVMITGVSNWPEFEGVEFIKYGNTYYYRAKATVGAAKTTTYTIQFELEKANDSYILKAITAY